MFNGVGFTELLLIFVIGLLILGPERLPRVAAQVGRWVARARRTANQLRMQIEREVALEEIREAQRRVKTTVEGKDGNPPPGSADAASEGVGGSAAGGTGDATSEGVAPEAAGEPRPSAGPDSEVAGQGTGSAGEAADAGTHVPQAGAASAGEERPVERSTHVG